MPLIPLPHRVTFLAPRIHVAQNEAWLEQPAAMLMAIVLFEHFLRHPAVTVTDPDDFHVTDRDGALLGFGCAGMDDLRASHFGDGRRDELVAFELSLDPGRPLPTKLIVERYDGKVDEYVAMGNMPLAQQMGSCIEQWLRARSLPLPPRPLEPFDANAFRAVAHVFFETLRSRRPDGGFQLGRPHMLVVPYLRAVYVAFDRYTYAEILSVEPDNPWAIRDRFIDGLHNNGPTSREPIRHAIATAPMFGKLYLSMFGEDVKKDESLHAFAMASILIPGNFFALRDYGAKVYDAQRWDEGHRIVERACMSAPLALDCHIKAMEMYDMCRPGAALDNCEHHVGFLNHAEEKGAVQPGDPEGTHIRLRMSDSLMRAGRLQDAIALRRQCLQGLEGSWPNQTKVLRDWENDPSMLATLYAREAAMRGDPGRVVEGFRASPGTGALELSMFVNALLALGEEEMAYLAYAHQSRRQPTRHPVARLAGAKAALATGRFAEAIEHIRYVAVRFPAHRAETALNRLLRIASTIPVAEWEAIAAAQVDAGAHRLAKLLARDALDFVPGIAPTSILAQLAATRPVAFEPRWFAALQQAISGQAPLDPIEQLFATYNQPTLDHADRLAGEWEALVPEGPGPERAAKLLWLFAGAFGRYAALTTQPPNVLASGYRQVATDVLEAMRDVRGTIPRIVIKHLLEGLEAIAPSIDPWIFDQWLLRLERALDLEANEAGKLAPLTNGLPIVTSLLRGDEAVGWELRLAWLAAKDPARARDAAALYERCVRAIGRDAAAAWSAAAAKCLPPEQALDVHTYVNFATSADATPAVEAAKILLQQGKGARALAELCRGLSAGGKQWIGKQVASLAQGFQSARVPVPADFNAAQQQGLAALQQGDFATAVRCYEWCAAQDWDNAMIYRNLGIAQARLGKVAESLAAFARADEKQAPSWTGQALREANLWDAAHVAYRYASQWYVSGEEWIGAATAAYMAEDNDLAIEGYGRVEQLKPALLDPSTLNAYAGVLVESGHYDKALQVAQWLEQASGGDPTWTSNAAHHRADALLGLGRAAEALPHAQASVAQNRLPDNQAAFAETVARCQRNDPKPKKASKRAEPEAQAFRALEDGDMERVRDVAASAPGFRIRRAAILSLEMRLESENDTIVTPRALERARAVLKGTNGVTDRDALLVRFEALRIRENARFPVDPPAKLGTRLPRDRFRALFAERSGRPLAQAGGGAGAPTDDVEVFPGQRVGRASDYVRLMKAMQAGNPQAALQQFGLDMQTYGQVAMAWNQRMQADPALAARVQAMMMAR